MRVRVLSIASLLMLSACAASDPAGPGSDALGVCVAFVQIRGVTFVHVDQTVDATRVWPTVYERVRRGPLPCNDVIINGYRPDPVEIRDGDSNFLVEGTELYRLRDRPAEEALTTRAEDGRWLLLEAVIS